MLLFNRKSNNNMDIIEDTHTHTHTHTQADRQTDPDKKDP